MSIKEFFNKNKVLIIGLASAIFLAVSELIKGSDASIKMIVFSGLIAAASYLGRNLRGQWASIIGLVGNTLAAFLTQEQNGTVSYSQLIIQFIVSVLAVVAAPAKSIGYEMTPVIEKAKEDGKEIQTIP